MTSSNVCKDSTHSVKKFTSSHTCSVGSVDIEKKSTSMGPCFSPNTWRDLVSRVAVTCSRLEDVLSLVASAVSLAACAFVTVLKIIAQYCHGIGDLTQHVSTKRFCRHHKWRVQQNRAPPQCDDDSVRYVLNQIERGQHRQRDTRRKRQARHTSNEELAGNEQLQLILPRKECQSQNETTGQGNDALQSHLPTSLALNPFILHAVKARDWAPPLGSCKQHLNTLERPSHQHPSPSAWNSLMPKAVTTGVVCENSLEKNVFLVVAQLGIDESHVIAQNVGRRETSQRIYSIQFSRNLHNFDKDLTAS